MKIHGRVGALAAFAAVAALLSAGTATASSSQSSTTHHASAPSPKAGPALNSLPPVGLNSVNYTGNGFDTCSAPSEAQMAAWRKSSPYDAIGINIGGANRACAQPNLTPQWVRDEAAAGWHFFLLYAGPQAPGSVCTTCTTMSDTLTATQAYAAASDAEDQAAALGFQPGTPIFYDLQDYADGGSNSNTVENFLSDWHNALGFEYPSGVHGGMGSTVHDLISVYSANGYSVPFDLDFASGNGQQSVADSSIPAGDWSSDARINQYAFSHSESWGGTTLTVSSDYLDLNWRNAAWARDTGLYAIGADGSVMLPLGSDKWFDLGAQATQVYSAQDNVYALFPNGQGIYEFDPNTAVWTRIGGSGAQFALADGLYGLTPDRSQVYKWSGQPGQWQLIGGPASAIYGGNTLVATNPANTAAYEYTLTNKGPEAWRHIGGGGAEFVSGPFGLFGLTPDRSAVYEWNGTQIGMGTGWTRIGGAAQHIYEDPTQSGTYATSPGDSAIYSYQSWTNKWTQVGGAGVQFASCGGTLAGLQSVNGALYTLPTLQTDPEWTYAGSPIKSLGVCS